MIPLQREKNADSPHETDNNIFSNLEKLVKKKTRFLYR